MVTINIYYEIDRLINYGTKKKLVNKYDEIYIRNKLLNLLKLDEYENKYRIKENLNYPNVILENILKWTTENKKLNSSSISEKEILDTMLMDCILPRPSEVINNFYSLLNVSGSKTATDYFYNFSNNSNYIRKDKIKKDRKWKINTKYGKLDITINLSKPEKDLKEIEKAKNIKASSYPLCFLCKENEGYKGRLNHPARSNHRIIPISLCKENWFFQYSPYVYYDEHCIIFKDKHEPMKISKKTFDRILEFLEIFPHYFIGSNADLPIVGGSILSHDHFQGGVYQLPMVDAKVRKNITISNFENIKIEILNWPSSVIRIRGKNKKELSKLAWKIFQSWKNYDNESLLIKSFTKEESHNTITPIGRRKNSYFELDLVLRNNRCDKNNPEGIFHPNKSLHHIKKENIGLIEVLGLAVLPARLNFELEELKKILIKNKKEENFEKVEFLKKHKDWYFELKNKYKFFDLKNINNILQEEVGNKFLQVLECTGVFKNNEEGQKAFEYFIKSINLN